MQAGKLQHLISIEHRASSQNDAGDFEDVWEAVPGFARIMAEVLPDRAQEFFAAQQIQASRNALVRLYFQPGITERMRVVHHKRPGLNEYWDIVGCIDFQSKQRELRLMCQWWESEGYRRGADLPNV